MNKKILLFDAPKSFLTYPKFIYNSLNNIPINDGYDILDYKCLYDMNFQRKLKYTMRGANEISSYCKILGYDITHFDYDARLIKKFSNISLYLNELTFFFEEDETRFNLNFINNQLEIFFSEFDCNDSYDYILCSLQRDTFQCSYINIFQIRFCLVLLNFLKTKFPQSIFIMGGDACSYSGEDWSVPFNVLNTYIMNMDSYKKNPFIDKIIIGSVTLEKMKLILEDDSTTDHSSNTYTDVSYPPHKPLPIKNIDDLKYSYKFIFNHYGFDIPDESYSDKYIQQIESKIILGCIGQCAFCNTHHKIELMPFDKMTDLIMSYIDNGYNSFMFFNDAINPISEKFCNWVVKNNLNIHWSDDSRHSLDKSYYEMLFESGCKIINFGCETFDDDVLRYIKKGFTSNQFIESLTYSHEANLWNIINFITKLPYSKENEIDNNVEIVLRNEKIINKILFNCFYISKGSPFYKTPRKFGLKMIPTKGINGGYIWKELKSENYYDVLDSVTTNHYPKKLKNTKFLIEVPQHLIFALYDIFKTKDKVVNWMNENYYKKMEGEFKYLFPKL